jgi:cell division protein FtsI (penicillin-binding protein 3)
VPPRRSGRQLAESWPLRTRDADELFVPPLADSGVRLRISTAVIMMLLAVVAGRVVVLQVADGAAYAARGLSHRLQPVVLPAPRGSILDRAGNVLAHSIEARYIYADPSLIDDPATTADKLFPVLSRLGLAKSELIRRMTKSVYEDGTPVRFVYLARGVDIAMGDEIDAMNLKGVQSAHDEKREVPGHDLAANLIGFTGTDLTGLGGLESSCDDILRGVEGERIYEVGGGDLSTEIPGGYNELRPAKPGTTIQLTIDRDVQYETQHLLYDRMLQAKADWGAAVVLDVKTGEVLAQASFPSYDAANPLASPPSHRLDAATAIVVDPGSIHKAVVFAAALQEGVINADTLIPWQATLYKGDQPFHDTHPLAPGTTLTLPGILAYSSNIGTIKIADRLGADKLVAYQKAFGLGAPTNEGLPGEAPGKILTPDQWSGSGYGSIPIGASVSVTPLQMAEVYATIANNGVYVQPHLIAATIDADGKRTAAPAVSQHRVISEAIASQLRHLLQAVVTAPGATGRKAAIDGYQVAGKTGTGQQNVDGRYIPGDVASFIGMAPADNPRFVVAVFAHSPGGNGGDVSAPAFQDIMTFLLGKYRIPPSAQPSPTFVLTK